ncbi:MAG: hypothetical protein CSA85_00505 [Alphaproteobacteria bacterium]|nr:MAG: hypothetical protein CSA85_00505 [Alphaproteobacteria bacterium]
MKLEWNETKHSETLAERGLDFADVAALDWDTALTIEDTRKPYPEVRYVTMGYIKGRLCVVAWCYRGDAIRVISLRKANSREVRKYEQS